MRPGKAKWVFFNSGRGASWNDWDAALFGWFGNRFLPLIVDNIILISIGIAAAIAAGCWCRTYYRRRRRRSKDYSEINNEEFEFEDRTAENR